MALGLGAVGIALRLYAFVVNNSLFVDEAALTRNILDRPWRMLLVPLDFAQVAPPGFLLTEKAVVTMFGSSEQALRLFPLICGLASVWLCWAVARRVLTNVPAVVAVALFSLNVAAIEFSARVKPYACDVAAALLILWLVTKVLEPSSSRRVALWTGLAGAATVLFSFTATFVLGAAAITGVIASVTADVTRRRTLWLASMLWLAGAASAVLIGRLLISPIDSAYMRFFWSPGFMPLPPKTTEEALWLWYRFIKIFRWTGNYQAAVGWVGLAAIGVWSLLRRARRNTGILLIAPLLLIVVAAATRQYPFTLGRVDLFLLPMLLMLVAEGGEQCRRLLTGRWRVVGTVPLVIVLVLAVLATWRDFQRPRQVDMRVALQDIRSTWQKGDLLYVYYTAGQVFSYYGPRLGFANADYVQGTCSHATNRTPIREIDAFRGRPRLWVMALGLTHNPFLDYLDAMGRVRQVIDISGSDGATSPLSEGFVSLYDLSTATRPDITAESIPVAEETDPEAEPWTCYGVQNPIPLVRPARADE
jgi:hypothetical protein